MLKCKNVTCALPESNTAQFPNTDLKCPYGCKHYPRTAEAARNLYANGALYPDVCRMNPWRNEVRNT